MSSVQATRCSREDIKVDTDIGVLTLAIEIMSGVGVVAGLFQLIRLLLLFRLKLI
ncbi:hypothetical protein BD410DRAFT_793108 [Rickenella mellea]|uniref:Uncharacterized protein n=1 Tax=Rickenella mellea TaxID=50990 RepID=A0A4Y7PVK4_9AGAM|nr:hypothetical protein BD410DRAFT_793108 [Rickenella mellea]